MTLQHIHELNIVYASTYVYDGTAATAKRMEGAVVKKGAERASPLMIACGTFIALMVGGVCGRWEAWELEGLLLCHRLDLF